jgi:hypothetical protein
MAVEYDAVTVKLIQIHAVTVSLSLGLRLDRE